MSWFMRLERALVALTLYQHHEVDEYGSVPDERGWINRFTLRDRFGQLEDEVWAIRLPSWGMMYVAWRGEYRFCQRWVSWSSVTGRCNYGGTPV